MQERLHSTLPSDLLDKFQIIPSRVRDIDPDKIPILWLHDLPNDPESQHLNDPELRKRFKKIVAVSDWQMQLYNVVLGLPYSESTVIKNGIEPIDIERKRLNDTIIVALRSLFQCLKSCVSITTTLSLMCFRHFRSMVGLSATSLMSNCLSVVETIQRSITMVRYRMNKSVRN